MRPYLLLCPIFLSSLATSSALADAITYDVTVDTASISGTAGSLDLNFNPGPLATQAASLQILDFTTDGSLAENCPCGTGDVTGQLPATLMFDNGAGFNDYFDGFTYGSTLSFEVSIYGPALTTPDGSSTSGSTFAFSMFSDAAGTIPVLTTDVAEGFAFTANANLDGTTDINNLSLETTVQAANAPEPSTIVAIPLLILGLLLVFRSDVSRTDT